MERKNSKHERTANWCLRKLVLAPFGHVGAATHGPTNRGTADRGKSGQSKGGKKKKKKKKKRQGSINEKEGQ